MPSSKLVFFDNLESLTGGLLKRPMVSPTITPQAKDATPSVRHDKHFMKQVQPKGSIKTTAATTSLQYVTAVAAIRMFSCL